MNQSRLNRIVELMKQHDMDQIIISSPNAIYYLLDEMFHPGERLLTLLVKSNGEHALIVNALFPNAKGLDTEIIFYDDTEDPIDILKEKLDPKGTFGVDKEWPSHFLVSLMKKLPEMKIEIGSVCVDTARMMKDEDEVIRLREASRINDLVMGKVFNLLKEKKYKEAELKKMIPALYEAEGTKGMSFSPAVCYGQNSAIPHHESGAFEPKDTEALLIDMGGITNGYCSDMTRSFHAGTPSDKYKEVYNLVLQANLSAIAAVKPGVKLKDVDLAARNVITEGGYGEFFTHRTGHGIGIEVHEFPDVSSINEMELQEGMAFSIEPGIYLEGEFGVRIEDIVVVTKDGCEVLNKYTKELQTI